MVMRTDMLVEGSCYSKGKHRDSGLTTPQADELKILDSVHLDLQSVFEAKRHT
jgi:hypothetical protein